MTGTVTERIAAGLEHLVVPVGQVSPWPGNARRGDVDRIAASLTAHGQYAPLLVQASTGHVIKGNHTLEAALRLGWTRVAVLRLDVDDDRARAMVLVDNWTSDTSGYDDRALAELLREVGDWTGVGWTADDLDGLLADLTDTGGSAAAEMPSPTPSPAAQPATAGGGAAVVVPTTAVPPPPPPAGPADAEAEPRLEPLVLRYPPVDRAEAERLVAAARDWLGAELSAGEVVLRALRALAVIGDSRHDPGATVRIGSLLFAAGRDPLATGWP